MTSKRVSGPRLDNRPMRILRRKLRGVIAEEEEEDEVDDDDDEFEIEDKLSCFALFALLLLFNDIEGTSLFCIINTFPEVDNDDFPSEGELLLLLL